MLYGAATKTTETYDFDDKEEESKMTKSFITLLIALFLMANSIQLVAQEDLRLVPGKRVRVTASKFLQRVKGVSISRARRIEKLQYVGSVVALNADTLVMKAQDWDESFFIPFENLKKLELSRGTKSNLGKGAKVGCLVGAGLEAIIWSRSRLGN